MPVPSTGVRNTDIFGTHRISSSLPETRGRSLEQLDGFFAKRVPMLKFKGFVTEHVAVDAEKDPTQVLSELGKAGEPVIEEHETIVC
jgi:hypothetical protein